MASGFGEQTQEAFRTQIGRVDASSSTPLNVLRIISGSLWCKGYAGARDIAGPVTFADLEDSLSTIRGLLGLGSAGPYVDLKFMMFLLSMDSPTLLTLYGGVAAVRTVQQWLNGQYAARQDFPLCPADGVFSRQVLTAFLYGVQYEIGMTDGTANGNYGPGTRAGLRSDAPVGPGDSDGSHHFVRLFQGLLRCNGYSGAPFTGSFDSATAALAEEFQGFTEMSVTGRGDYSTWCGLLVSCGDTGLDCAAFDTNAQLTVSSARALAAAPFNIGGRYLVGGTGFISIGDLDGMRAAGLRLVPIYQRWNNQIGDFTSSNGVAQGLEALERARTLNLPDGELVFFAVDLDATSDQMPAVLSYFSGVKASADGALTSRIRVGVYGTRAVCQAVADAGLSEASYVAGASWGYSGNMGYPMPENWQYNQIEVDVMRAGINVDRVRVSRRAESVALAEVTTPPQNRTSTDVFGTGFDIMYEWCCRAETLCEQQTGTLTIPPTSHIGPVVAHYLRKLEYWNGVGEKALLWKAITPYPASLIGADNFLQGSIDAIGDFDDHLVPSGETWTGQPFRIRSNFDQIGLDAPHFAATFLGYIDLDPYSTNQAYLLGDLAGWALDLLSVWGDYERYTSAGGSTPLDDWASGSIGSDGGKFSRDDIIADADACLIAQTVLAGGSRYLSDHLRAMMTRNAYQRVGDFYQQRFGRSPERVSDTFYALMTDLEVGGIPIPDGVSAGLYQAAADAKEMPNEDQVRDLGRAYASVMAEMDSRS